MLVVRTFLHFCHPLTNRALFCFIKKVYGISSKWLFNKTFRRLYSSETDQKTIVLNEIQRCSTQSCYVDFSHHAFTFCWLLMAVELHCRCSRKVFCVVERSPTLFAPGFVSFLERLVRYHLQLLTPRREKERYI